MATRHNFSRLLTIALLGSVVTWTTQAAIPTATEMDTAQEWANARFSGISAGTNGKATLTVLANNDPVQRRSRNGKPMNINGKRFDRGLYCHAVSDVVVKLPKPAKTFLADIGVDSNGDTSGGKGSVEFIVRGGEKELFRSNIIREGKDSIPVSIPLNGLSEFSLVLTDGGDGISCDQSDWANARVILDDGSELWLDEIPFDEDMTATPTAPMFSFVYDGKSSGDLLPNWNFTRIERPTIDNKKNTSLIWQDPQTGMEVRCEAVAYQDFPTVEWTVYFTNNGKEKSPILEKVLALDATFPTFVSEPQLHHLTGAPSRADDYQPFVSPLKIGQTQHYTGVAGRPTDEHFPYYNIDFSGNGGLIMVVGWPGQWAADFKQLEGNKILLTAGQEITHLRLNPGESIRTPLMALQFWKGDYAHSQNVWRSWMLTHNVPRIEGKVTPLHWAACSSHQYAEMIKATSDTQKNCIDRYLAEGIKLDYWWMDAGWYINEWGWPHTGTWEVDQKRFPGGFKPISDHANAKGVRTLVWFEPERVTAKTWLFDNHPEWLLPNTDDANAQRLLNLGNPEALDWLINHIDKILVDGGISLYRQDYNIGPLSHWRFKEDPDRLGIIENHYVVGYLKYWDTLRSRHPNMLIDSCASGGRRNDLETMRRSVPLLRSDWIFEPTSQQGHSYGMAHWIPLFGTGIMRADSYGFRSCMTPYINSCWDIRPTDQNFDNHRADFKLWNTVKEFYYGDYYTLTPYSLDNTQWIAWQYHKADTNSGMVQAFCRPESPYESMRVKLKGLTPNSTYKVWDYDGKELPTATGKELMEKGVSLTADRSETALVILYKEVK